MNEYERFLSIRERRLPQPPRTGNRLADQRVLVTGGTGCIGSELIRQLLALGCAKIGSIANGPDALLGHPRVHYYYADVRDYPTLDAVMAKGWDVVFHCAAQRDPGLAELERERTITTNGGGTANALNAAERHGVEQFVFASTGKALRPFSPDTYTATKRIAEWLLARSTIRYRSGARFTHVVDNSIIHERLLRWARAGEPIRLHADGILFYAQSAIESAQLLIGATEFSDLEAEIHAIKDLGMPIDLTAMAADLIQATGSQSRIEFVGYADGYEATPFPGLYDPETAFDISPLINAFEADIAFKPYDAVDAFPLRFGAGQPVGAPFDLNEVSWRVMEAAMATVRPRLAGKVARLCAGRDLLPEHDRMLAIIESRAGITAGAA
jgi:FlaA1/EpsC-like NDP-sugar epimerase